MQLLSSDQEDTSALIVALVDFEQDCRAPVGTSHGASARDEPHPRTIRRRRRCAGRARVSSADVDGVGSTNPARFRATDRWRIVRPRTSPTVGQRTMPLLSFEHVEEDAPGGSVPEACAGECLVLDRARRPVRRVGAAAVWEVDAAADRRGPRADTGRVRFLDVDFAALRKESRDRLRLSEIGLARGEGPPSRSMTVLEYASVPLLATRTRLRAQAGARVALRRVDVAECGDAHWDQLSDDERALVSLAHGLVRDPQLLLSTIRLLASMRSNSRRSWTF